MATFSSAAGISMQRASLPLADVDADPTARPGEWPPLALASRTPSELQPFMPLAEAGRPYPLPDTTRPVLISGNAGTAASSSPYIARHASTLRDTPPKSEREDSGSADSDPGDKDSDAEQASLGDKDSDGDDSGSADSVVGERDDAGENGAAPCFTGHATQGAVQQDDTPPDDGDADSDADIDDLLARVQPGAQASATNATPAPGTPASSAFTGANQIPTGQIVIGKFLANGAFGMVYRGTWGDTDVALKKIDYEHARQRLELSPEEVAEALEWEVARLATTHHPNLVQFHGICHKEGASYLVLEFCHNGSLQGALRKGVDGAPIPVSRLWQWMMEISQALAYLHNQGMLHRDLKAENVLIDQYGRARLADLGVAQVDALLASTEAHAVNQGLQDMDFIAPENVGAGRNRHSSKATDIYALGVVFWQMVSRGDRPTPWQDVARQDPEYRAIKKGERMPMPDDCPPLFRKLIRACWHADPAKRAGIAEVLKQLQDMAPAMHPEHALVGLTWHLEQALHARREDARHYVPSQVTLQPIEGSIEAYWERFEQDGGKGEMHNPPRMLQGVLEDFMAEPGGGALLLLGEGGLGKTLSTYVLADRIQQQWWLYFADPGKHPKPKTIPVFIRSHVPAWTYAGLKNACTNILGSDSLRSRAVTPLVFVDGYDECRFDDNAPGNLALHLGLPADARLIVTCRPDTVPQDQQQERFAFESRLQSCHYLSFNTSQLLAYLKQHLAWDEATYRGYEAKLRASADLRAALRNPFVLYLLWQSWETVSRKPLEGLSRPDIYEGFIEHMVNTRQSLLEGEVLQTLQSGHATLPASFQAFANQTALLAAEGQSTMLARADGHKTGSPWAALEALAQEQAQQVYRERQTRLEGLSPEARKEQARRMVLTEEDYTRLRQQKATQFAAALPLRPRAGALEFIHKSVFEYCLAQGLLGLLAEGAKRLTLEALEEMTNWMRKSAPEALLMMRAPMAAQRAAGTPGAAEPTTRQQIAEAKLLVAISRVLVDREMYGDALDMQFHLLAICKKMFGLEHADTAQAYFNIGMSLGTQGKIEQALAYHHEALTLREKVVGSEHPDTADSCNWIAVLLADQGRYDEATGYFERALATLAKVRGSDHPDIAPKYINFGLLLSNKGMHQKAMEYYLKALAIKEKAFGSEHISCATIYNNIGSLYREQGKLDEARVEYDKALKIREKCLGNKHSDTAVSYNNIGHLLQEQGKPEEALEKFRSALTIQEQVFGVDHPTTATYYGNIGSVQQSLGKHEQALEEHSKALAIRLKVFGSEHPDIALSYSLIARSLQEQDKHDQALEYYRKALDIRQTVFGRQHPDTAHSLYNIGARLRSQGSYDQAMRHFQEAREIQEQVLGEEHTDTANTYEFIGMLLDDQGRFDEARKYYDKTLAISEKVYGVWHATTADAYNNIAVLLMKQGSHDEAMKFHVKALAIRKNVLGAWHTNTAMSYNNIGSLLKAQGAHEAAMENYRDALAIYEKVCGSEHSNTARSHNNIGLLHLKLGNYEQAKESLGRALTLREKALGSEHIDIAMSHNNLACLLQEMGEPEQAVKHFESAIPVQEKVLGMEHIDIARTCSNMGNLLKELGRFDQALVYYRKALTVQQKVCGPEHTETAASYGLIALLLRDQGNHQQALANAIQGLDIEKKVFGARHPDTIYAYWLVGDLVHALGRYQQSMETYQRVLEICEKEFGARHNNCAACHHKIGHTLKSLRRNEEALAHLCIALSIWEEELGARHPDIAASCNDIGETHQALGDRAQALAHYRKALDIAVEHADPAAEKYRRNVQSMSESRQDHDHRAHDHQEHNHEDAGARDTGHKRSARKSVGRTGLSPKNSSRKDADQKSSGRKGQGNKDSDKCVVS